MDELNKGKWGARGAKAKRPNWPNLNIIFCKKIFLFAANFKLQIKSTMVSKLKKKKEKKKDEDKICIVFFCIFGKFKFHFSF
jgi:hypothetical protein